MGNHLSQHNQRKYKFFIALIFGLLGFAVNFYPLHFFIPPHKASLVLGLVFPMLISLAWGWRYSLVSLLLGLGGQTMWFLWVPINGWAPFVAIPVYNLWIIWHGWCIEKKNRFLNNYYTAEILFRIFNTLIIYTLFRWVWQFNPSPWAPMATLTTAPMPFVNFIAIKQFAEGLIILFGAHVLLNFQFMQRILLIEKRHQLKTDYIISAFLLFGLLFWLIAGFSDYLYSTERFQFLQAHQNQSLAEAMVLQVPGYELLTRTFYILTSLVAGLIVAKYATRLKESELAKEEAYQIINTSNSVAFLWQNKEGWPVQFVSENVGRLFGFSAQEFISGEISYLERIHPEDQKRIAEEVASFSADKECLFFSHKPYRVITKEKEVKWVSDSTYIRRNEVGQISHYQGIVEDITLRHNAEENLRKKHQEWQDTFDVIPDIITIQDSEMRIVQANRTAHTFFEEVEGGLVGKHCYEVFRGITSPCPNCPLVETLHDTNYHSETILHDNLKKVFQVSSSPILGKKGELQLLVHIAKDVTEQKRVEEELFQAHKMEAIGTLAGGIAHDFNNILTSILGYSELTKLDCKNPQTVVNNIEEVIKAGKRATELVKQILTFSRKTPHQMEELSPHLIIKEALKMLRSSIPTSIELQADIDSQCGSIMADPTKIHQIIVNLCTNALHALEAEKGLIIVKLQRQIVVESEISGEPDVSPGPFIVLEVTDTGHGMDQTTADHIFEPYFTTKEVGKGTGLGLAVISGIVHDYHGFIRVKSSPGEGSSFFIYLPALPLDSHTDQENKEENNTVMPTGIEHILVVDDEKSITDIHKSMLENLGYQVTAVTDSRTALAEITASPDSFDMLLTDQTMPGLSGAELAKQVLSIKPTMPIILCTGYSSVLPKEDAITLGIKKYLSKPISQKNLAEAVIKILNEE